MTYPLIAPLRPFGAAELLDGAVRLVRSNLRAVLVISVPYAIVRTALDAVLQLAALDSSGVAAAVLLGELIVAVFTGTILAGLLAPMYAGALLGRRIGAQASVAAVGRGWLPLSVLTVTVTAGEAAGVVALGVGGMWLWGVWALAAPALVLERTGVRGALGRSFRLVSGTFWRTFGLRALGWVLTYVLGIFVSLLFDALALYVTATTPGAVAGGGVADPALYVAITSIGGLIGAAVLGPVAAAVDVLLYTDLRMRREGMDIVMGLPPAPDPASAAVSAW